MNFFSTKKFFWLGTIWIIIHLIIFGPYSFINYTTALHHPPDLIPFQNQIFDLSKWSPFVEGGVDRLSTSNQNFIELFLFSILPDSLVFFILQILIVLIPIFFTKKLLFEFFSLDQVSSIFGAFLYGSLFSSANHLFFSYALIPMVIYILEKILNSDDKLIYKFLYFGLIVFFWAYTCHIPYSYLMITPAVFFWFFIIHPINFFNEKKKILILFLFFLFIFLLRINDIEAILYSLENSVREDFISIFDSISLGILKQSFIFVNSIDHSFYFFYTSFFLCWTLILFSFLKCPLNKFQKKLSLILALFIIVLLISPYFLFLKGFFLKISFSRLFGSYSFYISILVAICFFSIKKKFLKNSLLKQKILIIFSFSFLFIYTLESKIVFSYKWITLGSFANNFQSKYLFDLSQTKNKDNLFRVEGVTVPDSLTLPAYKFEIFTGDSSTKSKRISEYWRLINYPRQKKDYNIMSRSLRLYSPEKKPYLAAKYFNLNLLSLANIKYLISRDEIIDENLIKIKSTKKDWNKLTNIEKLKINFKENFFGKDYYNVYENKSYIPRVFLAKKFKFYDDKSSIINGLKKANVNTFLEYAFLNKKDLKNNSITENTTLSKGDYEIIEYSYDKIVIKTIIDKSHSGFLVLLNSYNPFWKVNINNDNNYFNEDSIIPTYHCFWGVLVPSGESLITFTYEPPKNFLFSLF